MLDSYGRTIEYMRLSITDRCNLRCKYCMPDGVPNVPHAGILTYEEYLRICRIAVSLGIDRFKVTGGEPLVRRNCTDFVRELKVMEGVKEVTLTTNGLLLADKLDELLAAGVDGITVSMDSLDEARYCAISGYDKTHAAVCGNRKAIDQSSLSSLDQGELKTLMYPRCPGIGAASNAVASGNVVTSGSAVTADNAVTVGSAVTADNAVTANNAITDGNAVIEQLLETLKKCCASGIRTKINTVLLEENRDDIVTMAHLAEQYPIDVRFIELMPIGYGADMKRVEPAEALAILREVWPDLTETDEKRGNGPARHFASDALQGRIGFINAVSQRFCESCNRVRLTSTGFFKPCLCYDSGTDLMGMLRGGCSDEEIRRVMEQWIGKKPMGHCFSEQSQITEKLAMSQIGG